MSNYYFHAIVLENCPYSNAALELFKEFKNNKVIITTVNQRNKENYKTEEISTFPQIYFKKNNSKGSLLLGGYSELKNIVDSFKNKEYSIDKINNFISNNKKWSKKAVLRLIELIN